MIELPESVVTIILGILEGVTEFLPISSTGHLLIAEHYLGARTDAFNVIIQAGAVTAVVAIYWRKLLTIFLNLGDPANRLYVGKIAFSVAVTIAGCVAAKKLGWELPKTLWPVVIPLVLGGLIIFWAEYVLRHHQPSDSISWSTAAWIGAAQVLAAIFPGTSRSGATIITGMFCGLSRPGATEFSFLVSIPTMYAASAYQAFDAYKAGLFQPYAAKELIVGFVISMITAFIVVTWLLKFVRSHTFVPFAWYRIALGVLLAWLLWDTTQTPADLH